MWIFIIGAGLIFLVLYQRFMRVSSPRTCPPEPYLATRGLHGRRMCSFEVVLDHGQESIGLMINVNAFFIKCKQKIEKDDVMEVLRKLYHRHPTLRMRTVVGTKAPTERYFAFIVPDKEPDLEVLATGDWKEVLHDELNMRFSSKGLQWRVKMLSPHQEEGAWVQPFVVSFNHSIVDGGSIMSGFITDFLKFLDRIVTGSNDGHLESLPLLPSRDVMIPQIQTSFFEKLLKRLPSLHPESYEPDKATVMFYNCVRPKVETERKTKLIEFALPESVVRNIVSKCKGHGLKVNGYLTAAAALGTVQMLKLRGAEISGDILKMATTYLVNLRRFAQPPISTEQLITVTSFMPLDIVTPTETSEDTFWRLAQAVHEDVHTSIAKNTHIAEAKALAYELSKNYQETIDQWSNSEYPFSAFTLTNRGNFQIESEFPDHDNHCSLDDLYYATADYCFNASVVVHSIQTINGRLMWSMGYCTHKTTDENAKEYVEIIKGILEDFSETGDTVTD